MFSIISGHRVYVLLASRQEIIWKKEEYWIVNCLWEQMLSRLTHLPKNFLDLCVILLRVLQTITEQ